MHNPIRPVEEPVQQVRIEDPDFSFDETCPQVAIAIEAQIGGDDASDDFIEEKLHSNVRSPSTDSMTGPYCLSNGRALISLALSRLVWPVLALVQLQV